MTVHTLLNRRSVLASAGSLCALALAGCTTVSRPAAPAQAVPPKREFSDALLHMYGPIPEERFPVPAADLERLDPDYHRKVIDYPTPEAPGTVIVDTSNRYLYHVGEGGKAMRYGVGIGRAGFEWSGRAHVAYGREWPVWTPPAAMIERQPELVKWRNGQPPGIQNALGARALYIHQGNTDTLYRLHGTGEAHTIGKAISSGCVRLLHQDIIHLYEHVRWGSPIVVLT